MTQTIKSFVFPLPSDHPRPIDQKESPPRSEFAIPFIFFFFSKSEETQDIKSSQTESIPPNRTQLHNQKEKEKANIKKKEERNSKTHNIPLFHQNP